MSNGKGISQLRVSVVTGGIVPRDAMSTICRQQVSAMKRWAAPRAIRLDVKVYASFCEVTDSQIAVAGAAADVALDSHFMESDVILYHFGIFNPLFDSIHLAPRGAKVVVFYHGITPPALAEEKDRATLYQSYVQATNMHLADQIMVTSQCVADDLARLGIADAKVVRVPPATGFNAPQPARTPRPFGKTARFAYVGRFVPAKGVLDLLQAIRAFRNKKSGDLRLDLIGSRRFSDPAYIERLHGFIAEHGLHDVVHFHFDADDSELKSYLDQADALVLPSYHEGFCVPLIEAMGCGSFVICSNAGALPETSGGLGRTFPVGDADALCSRLQEFVDARRQDVYPTENGALPSCEWRTRVADYVANFSHARIEERFCSAVFGDLSPAESEVREYLAKAGAATIMSVRDRHVQTPINPAIARRLAEALATAKVDQPAPAAPTPLPKPSIEELLPSPKESAGSLLQLRQRMQSISELSRIVQRHEAALSTPKPGNESGLIQQVLPLIESLREAQRALTQQLGDSVRQQVSHVEHRLHMALTLLEKRIDELSASKPTESDAGGSATAPSETLPRTTELKSTPTTFLR